MPANHITSSPNLCQWNYSGTSRSMRRSPLFGTSSYQRKWLISVYVFFSFIHIFIQNLTLHPSLFPHHQLATIPSLCSSLPHAPLSLPHPATSRPHLLRHRIHHLRTHSRRSHSALPAPSCHAFAASDGAANPSELPPCSALTKADRSLSSGRSAPRLHSSSARMARNARWHSLGGVSHMQHGQKML